MQKKDVNENFQAESTKQGEITQAIAEQRLRELGFSIDGVQIPLKSVEIDVMVTNHNDVSFPFTIKGSWRGSRPGLIRTDTLRKAIAECYLIKMETGIPAFVIASHIPHSGRGREMLQLMDRSMMFDIIHLFNDVDRLKWLLNVEAEDLVTDIQNQPNLFELIRERQVAKWR